jgi:uncharacterized protein (DUF1015 family)
MPLVRPFAALRPQPRLAQQVAAPPYDVLNSEEARALAAGKPWSFLHISKPEIDLPADIDPYAPAVYAKAKENFERMLGEGVLTRDPAPYYYLYRLVMGDHAQTGLVAVASVTDYESNRIRKHEYTRPDKEDDRVRQIDALNAQTGPVFLTYRRTDDIDTMVRALTSGAPDIDVTSDAAPTGQVRHSLWVVRDPASIAALSSAFNRLDYLYIADGHHRSAAAARVAGLRRGANLQHGGQESYNYFLAVIFPDNQMQILDYNRVIKDLNGLTANDFVRRLETVFEIVPSPEPVKPAQAHEFGMYLRGQWYRLRLPAARVPADPVRRLDVSLLADHVIAPILGITDPRRDKRIDFVGGIRGLRELARRVDSGEMAVAFSLFPTSLADLMAVADAGEVMPPKSTWFEPKLADGLASHVLD